jgi:hypothetical protein
MIPDIKKSKKRNARTNKKRTYTRKRRGTNKTSRKRGGASDADVSDYINIHQPGLNDRDGVKVKVHLKEGVKEGGKTGVFEGSLMRTRPLKEGGILFTIKLGVNECQPFDSQYIEKIVYKDSLKGKEDILWKERNIYRKMRESYRKMADSLSRFFIKKKVERPV